MNLPPLKEDPSVEKLQGIMVTGNENKGPTLPNAVPSFPVGDALLSEIPQSSYDEPHTFSAISDQDFGSLAKLMPSDFPDNMNNDSELIQRIGNELMRNLHDDSSRSSLSPLSSPGFHDGDLTSPEEGLPDVDTTTQMTLIEKSSELKLEESLSNVDSRTLWSIMSEDACDAREREEGSRKAFKSSETGDAPNSSVHLTTDTGNLESDGFDLSGVVSNTGRVDSQTLWNIIPDEVGEHEELARKAFKSSENCTIPLSSQSNNLDSEAFDMAGAVSTSQFIFQHFGKGILSKNVLQLPSVVTNASDMSTTTTTIENASSTISEHPDICVLKSEPFQASPPLPSPNACSGKKAPENEVSSSTGPPAKKLKEPSLNLQFPARSGKIELKMLVQPENQHRARYMTEGSRGAVKDQSQQGHPKIQLLGYDEPINLQVFVGTDTGKVKPHGFYQACKVCGKNSTPCSERDIEGTTVIEISLDPADEMTANIDCVGILKLRNADVEQRIGLARSKKKSTRARLAFRVCIPKADGTYQTLQVVSTAISCTQPAGQPEICKKSLSLAPATGAEELYIIGKNFSKGTKVMFQEVCDEKTVWSKEAEIDQEYFQATHLICNVPAYGDNGISKPVEVQIVVHSSGRVSEPHTFSYQPVAKDEQVVKGDIKEDSTVEEEVAMETDQGSRASSFVSPVALALNKMYEEGSHGISNSSSMLPSLLVQEQKLASLAKMVPAPIPPQATKCLTTPTNTTNANKPMVVTPTLEQLLSAPNQVSVESPPTPPTSALNMPPSLSLESNIQHVQTLNSTPQETPVLDSTCAQPTDITTFTQCSSNVTSSMSTNSFLNSSPTTKTNPQSTPVHITVPVTPDQLQNLLGRALFQTTASNIGHAAVPQVLLVQPQALQQGEPIQLTQSSQQQYIPQQVVQIQQCVTRAQQIQTQQPTTQQSEPTLQQVFQPSLQQPLQHLSFSVQQQSEHQTGQHPISQVQLQNERQVPQQAMPDEPQIHEPLEELRALQKQLKQEDELNQQQDAPMPQQPQEEPQQVKFQKPKISELPLQELQQLQQQIHQEEQQRSQQVKSPQQQNHPSICKLEDSHFNAEEDPVSKIVEELQNYEKQHQEKQNLQNIQQQLTQQEMTQQQPVQQQPMLQQQQPQIVQQQQPMQQIQIVQQPQTVQQQQIVKETPQQIVQQQQVVQQPQIVQQPQAFQQLLAVKETGPMQQQQPLQGQPSTEQQQILHLPQVVQQQHIIPQPQVLLQQQIVQQQQVGQPQLIQQHPVVPQQMVGQPVVQQIAQQPIVPPTVEQPQLVQKQTQHLMSSQQPSLVFQSAQVLTQPVEACMAENKHQNVQTITIIPPQPSQEKPAVSEGLYTNCMSDDMTESMVSNLINMLTTPGAPGTTNSVSTPDHADARGPGQQPSWATSMATSAIGMDDNSLPNVPIDDVDRLLNTSNS